MARNVDIPEKPGLDETGSGVWFSVASEDHRNFPPGTIIGGPYTRLNAGRPGRNQSMQDWIALRYAKGYVDRFMRGITGEEFDAQFIQKFHVLKGAGDRSNVDKPIWTREDAEAAKEIAGPKGRPIVDLREGT